MLTINWYRWFHLNCSDLQICRASAMAPKMTLNKWTNLNHRASREKQAILQLSFFLLSSRWSSSIFLKLLVPYFLVDYSHRCKQELTSLLLLLLLLHRLSGFVVIQVVVYFKLYQQDPRLLKGLVRHLQLFIHSSLPWYLCMAGLDCVVQPMPSKSFIHVPEFLSRLLDTSHTICIWLSLWHYLILKYGISRDVKIIAPYAAPHPTLFIYTHIPHFFAGV